MAPNDGKNSCRSFSRVVKDILYFRVASNPSWLYGLKNYLTPLTLSFLLCKMEIESPDPCTVVKNTLEMYSQLLVQNGCMINSVVVISVGCRASMRLGITQTQNQMPA